LNFILSLVWKSRFGIGALKVPLARNSSRWVLVDFSLLSVSARGDSYAGVDDGSWGCSGLIAPCLIAMRTGVEVAESAKVREADFSD
jgi:hypothetical protein